MKRLLVLPLILALLVPAGPPAGADQPPFTPRWVSGDLHVHTTWSHDSYGGPDDHNTGPDEFYTLGWSPAEQIAIAESRGLDFLALTDHNNTFSVSDPGWRSDRLTLVPAYENSLPGHAQMLNTATCMGATGPLPSVDECDRTLDKNDRVQVAGLIGATRASGGAFQINHPSDLGWLGRFGDGSHPEALVPDSVEVWNIGPWYWQHPMPASNDNDFSLRFWETYLNAGFRVAATGGSDNHWRSTTAAQGVGQPTTWVYVTRPGPAGIVEGIRAGRTTISHQPPGLGGPQLLFTADADGDGPHEAMPGDDVPAGAPFTVRAHGAAPGALVILVTDLGASLAGTTGAAPVTGTIPAGAAWARIELRRPDAQAERTEHCDPLVRDVRVDGSDVTYCRNMLVMEAMTSAMYVA